MRHSEKRNIAIVSFLLLILTFAISGLGQTSKGIIAGTVTDNSGAVVVGAGVTATNLDTGEVRTVQSGPTGAFRIEAVNLGKYKITTAFKGFQTHTITGVEVVGSVMTPVEIKLQVAGVNTDTITVTAENNQVQTENGEISGTISAKEMSELPLGGLNPIELALTQPGVIDNNGRGSTNGQGFSVNGGRPQSNNFLIDGQDNNDNSIQGQAFQPQNANAVQEVAIMTNSYSAEFGRGGSSVTNVIYKSGTNSFHGTLSELYGGSGLNAIDAADGLTGMKDRDHCGTPDHPCKARYDSHTFGFTVGGPIIKDKLFAFGSSVWGRTYGNESSTMTIPTATGVSQLQAYGSQNATLLLQYLGGLRGSTADASCYPTGIVSMPCVDMGNMTRIVGQTSTDTQWNTKIDYLPRQTDSITFHYLHDRGYFSPDWFANPGSNLPGFETFQGGPSWIAGGSWTHTLSPTKVNEFRVSYGHLGFVFGLTPQTAANPLAAMAGLTVADISNFPLLGTSSAFPQGRDHRTLQLQDGFTITRGSHTFKMGADVARIWVTDDIPINSRGTVAFSKGGGFSALGNFLDNFTGTGGQSLDLQTGNPRVKPTLMQSGYYFQDNWKILSNLTLNLGVRYEYQTNPENSLPYPAVAMLYGGESDFPTKVKADQQFSHISPRFGFAYTPHFWRGLFGDDKTVLRGGYGIFYDAIYTNILDNSASSSPNSVDAPLFGADAGGRGYADATSQFASLSPNLSPFNTVTSIAKNLTNPRTTQWNLDVERELPGNMLATVAYIGSRGQKLLVNDDFNAFGGFDPETAGHLPRYNPDRGAIAVRTNGGDSYYHGLGFKVERRFSKGLMLRSSYTFSKSIDDSSNIFVITGGSSYAQDVHDRRADRGLSAFNATHRWAFTYVWDVPGLHSSNKGLDAFAYLTRHWEWTGTTSLQSGLPDTVYVGSLDSTGQGHSYSGRPDVLNTGAPMTNVAISGMYPYCTGGIGDALAFDWATCATLTQSDLSSYHWMIPFGRPGNEGRNAYINPGQINMNFGINRNIPIPRHESQFLQLRVEMYNPFNHPNRSADQGGLWTTDVNTVLPDNPSHLFDTFWARQGSRNIKLSVKYQF